MKPIVNPDISNASPEYWEKVLKSHGLTMSAGLEMFPFDPDQDMSGDDVKELVLNGMITPDNPEEYD